MVGVEGELVTDDGTKSVGMVSCVPLLPRSN